MCNDARNLAAVREQAKEEVREEQFRAAVEEAKTRLRSKRSLLDRLLPFTITIRRKA